MERFEKGYPNLAAFADSDENFMLYRRFGYLQARVLLQKQDEMRALEDELDELDDADEEDFSKLYQRETQGEMRKKLLDRIETKFCEYGESILSYGNHRY